MTDVSLESLIGPGAMHDYEKATEFEQYRIRMWAPQLPKLTDVEFRDLCVDIVMAGAVSESRRLVDEEPYVKAAACIFEAQRRHGAAGHVKECEGDTLYKEGFNEAGRRFGLSVSEPMSCTCGQGRGTA